jgi:hypothetical protein
MLVLMLVVFVFNMKIQPIQKQPTRNPTKHTPLTLVDRRRTIGGQSVDNPLKGGFLIGSLFGAELKGWGRRGNRRFPHNTPL